MFILPTHCTATRKDGRPCRAWAVQGSSSPTCVAHGRRSEQAAAAEAPSPSSPPSRRENRDFTQPKSSPSNPLNYSTEELAGPDGQTEAPDLTEELAAVRVAVRRITQLLERELKNDEYAELVGQLFRGADTIARLLRTQRALSGEAADGLVGALAQVLNELRIEWQVDL